MLALLSASSARSGPDSSEAGAADRWSDDTALPVRGQNNGECPWNTLSIMDTLILLRALVFRRMLS